MNIYKTRKKGKVNLGVIILREPYIMKRNSKETNQI